MDKIDSPAQEQVCYVDVTQEAGRAFAERRITGPLLMLNLLRFREFADYSASPALAPRSSISGAAAYDLYITHTMPYLKASGGEVLFIAEGGCFLIGPQSERWDLVVVVRQSSVSSFFAFANDEEYLVGLAHRTAAIKDSRLLPMIELPAV